MKIASVGEMRSMDRFAIEHLGIPEDVLMENAGRAAVSVLLSRTGIRGKKFAIFCGSGNNGGDGLVVARLLHSRGGLVRVFLLSDSEKFRGAAATNFEIVKRLPLETAQLTNARPAGRHVAHCDVVIDAILGTGLDRPVSGLVADTISLINKGGKKVLSLDIPSGVNGNTGEIMGSAVTADYTVTFGLPKIGNLLYPGCDVNGELWVSHISFPPSLYDRDDIPVRTNDAMALPPRPAEAYKGAMGDVLFIAGAVNYYGAPYLSAMSFLKAGGGYARLAAPRAVIPVIARRGREIVYLPQEETEAGSMALKNKKALLEYSAKADMVVIGPGLSLQDETVNLVREIAATVRKPMLIDGDGLTAVAGCPDSIRRRKAATILTPHMGEMARLTGKSLKEIHADKIKVLRETVQTLNACIVLKGPHSLIGTRDGNVYVNLSGNAGMATAGSGDVLTGCIAAMFGMGLSSDEATRKGVFLHGVAGDLAAFKKGTDGMTAQDIMNALPQALKEDRSGRLQDQYALPDGV